MSKREGYLIASVLMAGAAALPQSSILGATTGALCGFFAIWYAFCAGGLK